ncbi:MAG: hydantoinase/oxoprolinase family protein [Candidatus Eisenbacteria bacterium]|uniref:Hydantoinase/oxoprolinase family protein n=1 Tax=Eiseniibacteriota bacterium TaxID=2212470 RepID=A0A849SIV9_UNCEI|nr:hydantoinase/oxoprolinase family protein [Candidatus Eisenbacteria bacterium]
MSPATSRAPRVVGIDTGGTFTDVVALVGRRLVTFKLPSDPAHPARPVLEGLTRLAVAPSTRVRHGSTVATNALLERRGARVVLVTTEGFEDVLEIGRQQRPSLYALGPHREPPLVPRERRLGARERSGPAGETWRRLDRAALATLVRRVRAARPEAIAIGLLHSYANPAHERSIARALARLGVSVTASSELCPEYREYERLATAVTNAYLVPRVGAYLEELGRASRVRIEVVLSHGGTAPLAEAVREPVRQLLSGPAGGLAAARELGRRCGFERALTLDVGGTSTDVAFLDGGLPRTRGREIGGFPVLLPLLDVHSVGAGGGSIARAGHGGLLRVGPESAGAAPGPAAYGAGGPATVTDALVVMGRIATASLAGGARPLDREASQRALSKLARSIAARSAREAAAGVVRVAEAHIEAALRTVSLERGHDPRGAALVAFGGAGGLHAAPVAEALGCDVVLWSGFAGVLSALGALVTGDRRETSRTVLLDARDGVALGRAFAERERATLRRFGRAERPRVQLERWAQMRYRGQSHELELPARGDLVKQFHAEHRRRFGFSESPRAIEVVTVEVRGEVPGLAWPVQASAIQPLRGATRGARPPHEPPRRTPVWDRGGVIRATRVSFDGLRAGAAVRGPAIVEATGATLWVPREWNGRLHASGTLVVTRARGRKERA